MLLTVPSHSTLSLAEVISGDASVAHANAYAMVIESLAGIEAPLRAQWLRAIALELERIANHTGDLGALANDIAFQPTAAACGKLRGDFLNMTALICGNRFGRGLVKIGGCKFDLDAERSNLLKKRLKTALFETEQAISLAWNSASACMCYENVGIVNHAQALDIGMVGFAARACGIVRDIRYDHPCAWHRFAQIPVAVWQNGDVFARARVRSLEIQRSGQFICEQLALPATGIVRNLTGKIRPNHLALALIEGWRGEVCHIGITNTDGNILHYKVIDPSFHNWTGLSLAMQGTAISDFPICNKSFNLSYCGFDL